MHIEGLAELTPEGSGGFSQVFRAVQVRYDREVAAKVLKFRLDAQADRDRFESECRAMGQLSDHPNIVPLYSTAYTDEGFPVIIMQYFGGGTLADRIRRGMTEAEVLAIGVQIASALHTAHERGVIHRDVKPQNVLMSRFGEPALTDFGISAIVARQTGAGRSTGITLAYAAPEAIDGEVTERTDVYSLAATLYTALARRRPFDIPGTKLRSSELVQRILSADPPALTEFGTSASVDAVIRSGLAKSPDRRPATAREFGDALRRLQREAGHPVTPWVEASELTDASLPTDVGSDDSITLVRRHEVGAEPESHEPVAEPAPKGNDLRRAIALGAAVVVLAAITLMVIFVGGSGDGDEPEPTPVPTTVPTLDPIFQQPIFAPTDVTIERLADGRAMVRWTDPNTVAVTFEIQRVDPDGRDEPLIESQTDFAELTGIGDTSAPCVTMRAVGDNGQLSPDIETPVCLGPVVGSGPIVAAVPPACAPGACDFRLDASGFAPDSRVSVLVLDPDGTDLNSLFGEAYASSAQVRGDGSIDWRFSPGSAAPLGRYQVTVVDDQSGLRSVTFFELTDG